MMAEGSKFPFRKTSSGKLKIDKASLIKKTPSYILVGTLPNLQNVHFPGLIITPEKTEEFSYEGVPHKTGLMLNLRNNYNKRQGTDLILTVQGRQFHCHKQLITSYSKYIKREVDKFTEMSDKTIILNQKELTIQGVKTAIYWMYEDSDKAHQQIKPNCLPNTLIAAKILEIQELVKQCENVFYQTKDVNAALLLLANIESEEFFQDEIQNIIEIVTAEFDHSTSSQAFLTMPVKNVKMILASNRLNVKTETDVLAAATNWLTYEWKERRHLCCELLSCVRFEMIDKIEMVSLKRMKNHWFSIVLNMPNVDRMIRRTLEQYSFKWRLRDGQSKDSQSKSTQSKDIQSKMLSRQEQEQRKTDDIFEDISVVPPEPQLVHITQGTKEKNMYQQEFRAQKSVTQESSFSKTYQGVISKTQSKENTFEIKAGKKGSQQYFESPYQDKQKSSFVSQYQPFVSETTTEQKSFQKYGYNDKLRFEKKMTKEDRGCQRKISELKIEEINSIEN